MTKDTKPVMGIGMLGDSGVVFKRKFRWTFSAKFPSHTVGESFVKLACRPTLEIKEDEINYLSAKTWIPGKASWQTMTTTYFDVRDDHEPMKSLYEVLRAAYDCIDKEEPQEEGWGLLKLYDGCGGLLETWTLDGLTVKEINFGELDHSSSSTVDLEVLWQYKSAVYEPSKYSPPPPCTSPSVESSDRQVEPLLGGEPEADSDRR